MTCLDAASPEEMLVTSQPVPVEAENRASCSIGTSRLLSGWMGLEGGGMAEHPGSGDRRGQELRSFESEHGVFGNKE